MSKNDHPLVMITEQGKRVFSSEVDFLVREVHKLTDPDGIWDLFDWYDPPPLGPLEAMLRERLKELQTQRDARIDSLKKRRDALVRRFEEAFADVELGAGTSISVANVIDDYGSPGDFHRAGLRDNEDHWSLVDVDHKDPGGCALTFMDAEGFRFYIPAYLVSRLRHDYSELGGRTRSHAGDSAITALESELCETKGFFEILTDEQSRCIAEFLLFDDEVAAGTDSLSALPKYWMPFLPEDIRELLE